jgi:hypothetical protein
MNWPGERRIAASRGRFRLFGRRLVTAIALCAVPFFAGHASAEGLKLTDVQRKALILSNFAKYIEWPESCFADSNAPLVIAILGKDPFGQGMEILRGKTIKGRNIEIKYFRSTDGFTNCHLLFISKSEMESLPQILKRLGNSSILTTAEAQGFIEQDGIINLVPERQPNGTETVGFEVNLPAAEKANLKLDTQLLRLAKRVKS